MYKHIELVHKYNKKKISAYNIWWIYNNFDYEKLEKYLE